MLPKNVQTMWIISLIIRVWPFLIMHVDGVSIGLTSGNTEMLPERKRY